MNDLLNLLRYFRAPFSAYKEAFILGTLMCAAIGEALGILTPEWHWVLTALWTACSLFSFIGLKEWKRSREED